jgi:hypothetical protein
LFRKKNKRKKARRGEIKKNKKYPSHTKLYKEDKELVRKLYYSDEITSISQLAEKFNVSRTLIYYVIFPEKRKENQEKYALTPSEYYKKYKDRHKKHTKKYYDENRSKYQKYQKKYYEENKEHLKKCSNNYYHKNKDEISKKRKEKRIENKKKRGEKNGK